MKNDPREAALLADEAARFAGALKAREAIRLPKGAATYVITSAQNNTHVHAQLWANLLAYARHRKARVLVSQFTYNKNAYSAREHVKPGSAKASDFDGLWYDEQVLPYVCNDRLALTPSLTFCGEVNVLPTAERPLSGFENYTGRSSAIFPHAKQEMQSVASTHDTKLLYTTGTVTLRNYLERKAGAKAEYQHAYGALIVEVDADGDWFVRQLRATEDGAFYDIAPEGVVYVDRGRVKTGHRVEGIQWGDVHVAQIDPVVRAVCWGEGGILDTLRPRYQFEHDTLDFLSRNHHEAKNPHELFRKHVHRLESVEAELRDVAAFIGQESYRDWCQTVVVDSNHDAALTRWLREADGRADPINAQFFLKAQAAVYGALAKGLHRFHLLQHLLRPMGVPKAVKFLRPGESFVLCPQSGGIEMGMHGDKGANGARGSARGFARMGRRVCVGHAHSASIVGDAFTAGTSSLLRMNYNAGAPSSWSHSIIVVFPNGCRTMVTLWKSKWRGTHV